MRHLSKSSIYDYLMLFDSIVGKVYTKITMSVFDNDWNDNSNEMYCLQDPLLHSRLYEGDFKVFPEPFEKTV